MKKIIFWLKAARIYTTPMTIMSWGIVFVWGITDGGNVALGILTLFGILLAHLGTNLFDDYLDYKKGIENIQNLKEKCWYLKSGETTMPQVLTAVGIYFGLATLIGLFLTIKVGWGVAVITFAAAILCLFYSSLTYVGLGEVLVGLLFSPFLYLGTYYVMTHSFSKELMLMAISTGILVVAVLYTHMLIDYDSDKQDNKITLCRLAGSKHNAFVLLVGLISLAYINITVLIFFNILAYKFLLVFLSYPLAIKLFKLMRITTYDPNAKLEEDYFRKRIDASIQLMAMFSVLVCIAKIL